MKKRDLLLLSILGVFSLCGCDATLMQSSNPVISSSESQTATSEKSSATKSSEESESTKSSSSHVHDYKTYDHDDDQHWKVCSCGEISEKKNHTWKTTILTQATKTSTGVKRYLCSACGAYKDETIPILEDTWSLISSDSNWSTDIDLHIGSSGLYEATVVFSTTAQFKVRKDHNWSVNYGLYGTADGANISVNTYKNHPVLVTFNPTTHWISYSVAAHEGEGFVKEEEQHYQVCKYCSTHLDEGPHTYDNGTTIRPQTDTDDGLILYTCTVCGKEKEGSFAAHEHTYSDSYIYDETYHWHPTTCGHDDLVDLDKEAHNFDEGHMYTAPSYTADGEKTYTCLTCGYQKVEPVPMLKGYKVTVDFNGGHSSLQSGSSYSGMTNRLSIRDIDMTITKSGYKFIGYSLDGVLFIDQNGNFLDPNFVLDRDITLVATFIQGATLYVHYDIYNEENTKCIESPTYAQIKTRVNSVSQTASYPNNTVVNLSVDVTEKYDFVGWYIGSTRVSANASYNYNLGTDDASITARFKVKKVTLTVSAYQPTLGNVALERGEKYSSSINGHVVSNYANDDESFGATRSINMGYGASVIIKAQDVDPSSYFVGWYDQNGALLSKNPIFYTTMPGLDTTYYAKWNRFEITYNMNGGTNSPDNPTSYLDGDSIITLKDPTHPDYRYRFGGWYIGKERVTTLDPSLRQNFKVTAKWIANDYAVTYHLNGGTNAATNPATYNADSNHYLADPTRPGYQFCGWFLDENFTQGNYVTKLDSSLYGDIDLYACWSLRSYTVTYNIDYHHYCTNDTRNPKTYTVEDAYTLYDCSTTLTGYEFAGWVDKDGVTHTSIPLGSVGDLYLYSSIKPIQYKLTAGPNSYDYGSVEITEGTGLYAETITVKATPKENCVFDGWYDSTNYKISEDPIYSFEMPNKDVHLTAKFLDSLSVHYRAIGAVPVLSLDRKTLTYGLYPQTHVSDETLIAKLDALDSSAIAGNGYYELDGAYYVKETAHPCKNPKTGYYFKDGTKVEEGVTYWFACEPIVWDVMSNQDGTCTLLAHESLDAHCYAEVDKFLSNQYSESSIRSWLLNSFRSSAFYFDASRLKATLQEKDKYVNTSQSTYDNIWIPASNEYSSGTRTDVGYSTATDYALAHGIYIPEGSSWPFTWTRDPYRWDNGAGYYISIMRWDTNDGSQKHTYTSATTIGVRPGIKIYAIVM